MPNHVSPPSETLPDTAQDGAGDSYAALIVENLDYIEKQCRKAVLLRSGSGSDLAPGWIDPFTGGESAVQELVNEVLDRLRANDYAALRRFQGKAKLTTYITTIIANLVIDLARGRHGRNRSRDRARELGPIAEQLYELVGARGYTLDAACEQLRSSVGYQGTVAELDGLLLRIRGRDSGKLAVPDENAWPAKGSVVATEEGKAVVVRDPAPSAEEKLVATERQTRLAGALQATLQDLDGEERLLLRLRFPAEEDEVPRSVGEIAALLGLTAKAVDNRLRRILLRCRQNMMQYGTSRDDLDSG